MTSPPVLSLRPDAIARPIDLDVSMVEAMMLWPDDPAARDAWERAAILEAGKAHLDDMPENLLRQYSRDALAAPRLADMAREADKRGIDGRLAGIVTLNATIYANCAPDRAQLGRIREELCQLLWRTHKVRPQTLNNRIVPTYRAVAHLWAAYMLATHHGDDAWPCRTADLGTFLATAEAIRDLAERSGIKKAPRPIMRPGEAVRLPLEVIAALPAVRLEIAGASLPDSGGLIRE